jgi:hypothetical protein
MSGGRGRRGEDSSYAQVVLVFMTWLVWHLVWRSKVYVEFQGWEKRTRILQCRMVMMHEI